MDVVKTYDLSKKYDENIALSKINMNVKQGEIYGLVGNNGAGKTTLLKILTGQTKSTNGRFELFSKTSEKDLMESRKRIGAIIEMPSFYPALTVGQNMEYYRIQRGVPGKSRVDRILKEVNLINHKKKKYADLSLGMKQRLGLALAMLTEPELLLLDEPINGIDPSGIIEIRNLLLRLNKEKNTTVIISSHILTELANVATCYGFLNNGELVEQISTKDLQEKCKSYIEIRVTNASKLAALIEQQLNYKNYKILQNDIVQIYDHNSQADRISELAISNKIGVLGLKEKSINLENYYMSLIGDVAND